MKRATGLRTIHTATATDRAKSSSINLPVVGLAVLITSFFYVLPLGRYSVLGISTDFRLYDFMFLGFILVFGLPNLNKLRNLMKQKELFFRWAMWVVFLAVASLIITALTSGLSSLLTGAIRAYRFLMYFSTAGFILALVDSPKKQKFLLNVFYVNIVIQMVLSIAQNYQILPSFWPDYWLLNYGNLPVGTLSPHHKQIGVVMLLGVAISLAYIQITRSFINKLIFIMLTGGMIAASIFSISRTNWLGLLALVGAFLYIQKSKGIIRLILIVLGLLTFYFFSPDYFKTDLKENVNIVLLERIEKSGIEGVIGDRTRVYDNIPDAIMNSPWILLIGTGFQNISYALTATGAHNNYLQVWFELGIVGFIIYMIFLYRILTNLAFVRKHAANRFQYYLSGNVWAGFIGVLATMLVGESLWAQYSMFTLSGQIMTMVALGCAPIVWKDNLWRRVS